MFKNCNLKKISLFIFVIIQLHLVFSFAEPSNFSNSLKADQPKPNPGPASLDNTNWSFAYFGYYSTEISDYHQGDPSVYMYHLFLLNYKISDRFRLSLRPSLTYNSGGISYGEKIRANSRASESQLIFIDNNPLQGLAGLRSKLSYKLYLPTDSKWAKIGTQTALGVAFEIEKRVTSQLKLGFETKYVYYFQAKDSYLLNNEDPFSLTPTLGQQFENYLKAEYYLIEPLSISQAVGLKDMYYKTSTDIQGSKAHWIVLETMLNFAINDSSEVSLGLSQNADTESQPFALYYGYESAYVLMFGYRF